MNSQTINRLNKLNRDFYNEVGVLWNNDPNYEWAGWKQLLPLLESHLSQKTKTNNQQQTQDIKYSIVDLGCGNGRFANFLASNLGFEKNIEYIGVDFSLTLLDKRSIQLSNAKLIEGDIINQDFFDEFSQKTLQMGKVDCITLFGLIHHIPSRTLRTYFFSNLGQILKSGSLLIFTTWQFLDTERLKKRVIDPTSDYGKAVFDRHLIDLEEFEEGDYLLDWVKLKHAIRYSHYFDREEIDIYLSAAGCELVDTYCNDGRESKQNKYYIARKL